MSFDPSEDDIRFLEICIDVHFDPDRPWWQRLWLAAKYVVGKDTHTCKAGYLLRPEDEPRFKAFFRDYEYVVWVLKNNPKGKNEPIKKDGV